MLSAMNHLLYLNDLHWRGSAYQVFLYAGILLTLILERRRTLRIVFGWFPLLYVAGILSPVSSWLLNLAGLFNDAYVTRLFSFMPLVYVITWGFMLLLQMLERTGSEWIKFTGMAVICAMICFTGHNVFNEPWLVKAQNYAKVPKDTLEIAEAVRDEHSAKIALIDENAIYMRQISDVVMPYGRSMGELGYRLSDDPPDVRQVMEMAGQQDMDYIVVHRSDTTLEAFSKMGYVPFALTEGYAIFSVEGVERKRRILNDKRQVVSVTNYDASGNAIPTNEGYYSECYTYSRDNREVVTSFLDSEGHGCILEGGYSKIREKFYLNGNRKSVVYLDQNDGWVLENGCYETRYRYNLKGQLVEEAYFDEAGKPMMNEDKLYASVTMEYDSSGLIRRERYFDVKGNPTLSINGYAEKRKDYDKDYQIIRESYMDVDGRVIGEISADQNNQSPYMERFFQSSKHAHKKGDSILFETEREGNAFNSTLFQLFDANTGNYLLSFGNTDSVGRVSGNYRHELPDGIYKLVFRGNTNLSDELISCLIYLHSQEELYYRYNLIALQDRNVHVSHFYIGNTKPTG